MLARIWRGATPKAKRAEYIEYINKTGVAEYRATPGNRGVFVLTRDEGETTEFLVLTLWDSMESIRKFAGDDPEKAKYYPEDAKYLLRFEPHVTHHELAVGIVESRVG